MHFVKRWLLLLAALAVAPSLSAQQGDLTIGNIEIPSFRWGQQTAFVPITNNSEYIKYITIESKMTFEGAYLRPQRVAHTHYFIEPQGSITAKANIDIPGSFGEAKLVIAIYDVVDTLDNVFPDQKVFEQPFSLHFRIPDAFAPYVEEKITLPPMVGEHPDWDNEFARVAVVLLNEGKTVAEIAAMAEADTMFVKDLVLNLKSRLYLKGDSGKYTLEFPIIGAKEAEEGRLLSNKASAELADIIAKNMTGYKRVFDSLLAAKAISADSNSFMDGGTILYRPYPVVAALFIWNDIGQGFVAGTTPLEVFSGSDPCDAYIPQYMYAVQGGDLVNGTQFYHMRLQSMRVMMKYGDTIPVIHCPATLTFAQQLQDKDWSYAEEWAPEAFIFDSTVTNPVIRALGVGAAAPLQDIYDKLTEIAAKYHSGKLTTAERYWFWNMVATKTLHRLVENKVLVRRGNGQFRIEARK